MSAQQGSPTDRSPATPPPPRSEEDWFRRYNERPQDTAAGRAALSQPGRADTAWSVDPIRLRLRELRTAKGLSLEGAAATSGVPAVVIGSYERGDRTPTAGRLRQLLAFYGYTLAVVPVGVPVDPAVADELRALADRIESGRVAA